MNDRMVSSLMAHVKGFSVPLRMGSGFDEAEYAALCEMLRACAAAWHHEDAIPKLAVTILLDLARSLDAASAVYDGPVANRVQSAAMEVDALVRACVAVDAQEAAGAQAH
jgi:hypothetical protein